MINSFHLYIIRFKNKIIPIIILFFLFSLILFSNSNIVAVSKGLNLWAKKVIPSLFPFLIATEMLSYTNIPILISNLLNPIMKPIFNLPGCSAYAFFIGIISGYPVGAKIVSNLKESNLCTKSEAERMLCFTNNSGPLFIIGTVGIIMYRNIYIGILLLITHILSAITIGIILGIISRIKESNNTKSQELENNYFNIKNNRYVSFSNLGEVLSNSILNSIKTMFLIGGFIVLFSVILSIINNLNILTILANMIKPINFLNLDLEIIKGFFSGLIEITNGLEIISNIPLKIISINIILSAFLLGFGGFSVLLQVLSIVYKSGLSIKKYLIFKFIQGIFAALYTYLLIMNFGFFNFNI